MSEAQILASSIDSAISFLFLTLTLFLKEVRVNNLFCRLLEVTGGYLCSNRRIVMTAHTTLAETEQPMHISSAVAMLMSCLLKPEVQVDGLPCW